MTGGQNVDSKRIGVPFAKLSLPSSLKDEGGQDWRPISIREYKEIENVLLLDGLTEDKMPLTRSSTVNSVGSTGSDPPTASRNDESPLELGALRGSIRKQFRASTRTTSTNVGLAKSPRERSNSDTGSMSERVKLSRPRSRSLLSAVSDENLSHKLFAALPEFNVVFSCGHWDNSIRVTTLDTVMSIQSVTAHRDTVTCLSLSRCWGKTWLASGSRDCTVMIWVVETGALKTGFTIGSNIGINMATASEPLNVNPMHILYGHDASVSCVDIHAGLNLVVSGSDDGTIILHSLQEGEYVRSVVISAATRTCGTNFNNNFGASPPFPFTQPLSARSDDSSGTGATPTHFSVESAASSSSGVCKADWVGISAEGYIVVYCSDYFFLRTYSINGDSLASHCLDERLYSLELSEDESVLLTGGDHCLVVLRWVHSLRLADDGPRKGFQCILNGETALKYEFS
jgi:WD40 repeat protein